MVLKLVIVVGAWTLLSAFLPNLVNCNLCSPLSYRIGVKVNCEHPVTKESINCKSDKVPVGTVADYKCEDFYVSQDGEGGQVRCNSKGQWTPKNGLHGFSCHIDCGKPGLITKWPWHATIFYRSSELESFNYACGGTLINPANKGFVIVTTSSCFPDTKKLESRHIKIALGLTSTEYVRNVESNYAHDYSVNRIGVHRASGLILLGLNEDLVLDETVLPVCLRPSNSTLPEQNNFDSTTTTSSYARQLVGFGKGRVQDLLRSINLVSKPCLNSSPKRAANFCMSLRSSNTKEAICTGDIGGGLIYGSGVSKEQTRYFLQGVLYDLEAEVRDDCSTSGIFSDLSSVSQWIQNTVDSFNSDDEYLASKLSIQPETTTIGLSFQRETPSTRRPTTTTTSRPLVAIDENGNRPYKPIRTTQSPSRPTERPFVSWQSTTSATSTPPLIVSPEYLSTTTESSLINPTDFQQVGLDWHNFYRRKHGVPEVTLSAKLNSEAQSEAEQWLQNHKFSFTGITNWFGSTGANLDSSEAAKFSIQDWYKTYGGYNWNEPSALPFTHIIWKSTTQIGIGVARKGKEQVVVAKYLRPIYFQHEISQAFEENVLPPVISSTTRTN